MARAILDVNSLQLVEDDDGGIYSIWAADQMLGCRPLFGR